MFIDSSAFMAILLGEPDAQGLLLKLASSRRKPVTSPIVRFEVVVSLARSRSGGNKVTEADIELASERLDTLMQLLDCSTVMVTQATAQGALAAAAQYGKVSGHPAGLNMGDCFSYAGAKASHMPLLYKGDDFAETDLA